MKLVPGRFQFHLSTAIMLSLGAGALMWPNIACRYEFAYAGAFPQEEYRCHKYGWPFVFRYGIEKLPPNVHSSAELFFERVKKLPPNTRASAELYFDGPVPPPGTCFQTDWDLRCLAADVGVMLVWLFSLALAWEWWIRANLTWATRVVVGLTVIGWLLAATSERVPRLAVPPSFHLFIEKIWGWPLPAYPRFILQGNRISCPPEWDLAYLIADVLALTLVAFVVGIVCQRLTAGSRLTTPRLSQQRDGTITE